MKQMIAFGDSNTWGLNPVLNSRYPENVRWTGLLRKKLSREGILLVEEGLCGRTTVFNDPIRKGLKGADDIPGILARNKKASGTGFCWLRKDSAAGQPFSTIRTEKDSKVWKTFPVLLPGTRRHSGRL